MIRKLVVLIRKNEWWRLFDMHVFGVYIIRNFRVHTIRICWRAYNTQFSRAYDTKLVGVHIIRSFHVHMIRIPHNLNPAHRIAYTYVTDVSQ